MFDYSNWSRVCTVLFPVHLASGEVVSFPGPNTAMQFDSRRTKEASSKVFPAFLMITERLDSLP